MPESTGLMLGWTGSVTAWVMWQASSCSFDLQQAEYTAVMIRCLALLHVMTTHVAMRDPPE